MNRPKTEDHPAERPLRLGVLGSGKGSNLRAILEAIDSGDCRAQVEIVLSDNHDAGILQIARERGIPEQHIAPGKYKTWMEPEIEQQMVDALRAAEVELVVLAGYMRVVKSTILEAFPGRIINIHPSLLPKYPGRESWSQALEDGVQVTGVTVHLVDAGVDTGPILAQREVPVEPGDTPESLHARIQVVEHQLYPWVVDQLAAGSPPLRKQPPD